MISETFNEFHRDEKAKIIMQNVQNVINGKDDDRIQNIALKDTHFTPIRKLVHKTAENWINYLMTNLHSKEYTPTQADLLNEFSKSIKKTGCDEKLQIQYISSIINKQIFKFEVYSKKHSGKNAGPIINSNGEVKTGRETGLKNIDAHISFTKNNIEYEVYLILKFIEHGQCGGGQDNQINDIHAQLKNATKCKDKKCYFVAIIDCGYGNEKEEEKIYSEINSNYKNFKNIKVCSSTDINKVVENIYNNI